MCSMPGKKKESESLDTPLRRKQLMKRRISRQSGTRYAAASRIPLAATATQQQQQLDWNHSGISARDHWSENDP